MGRVQKKLPSRGLFALGGAACHFIAGSVAFFSGIDYSSSGSKDVFTKEIVQMLFRNQLLVGIVWGFLGIVITKGLISAILYADHQFPPKKGSRFSSGTEITVLIEAILFGLVGGALLSFLPINLLRRLELPAGIILRKNIWIVFMSCFSTVVATIVNVPVALRFVAKVKYSS